MKIKLIAPARKPEWGESFWDFKTVREITGRKAGGTILSLPTLAALTPSEVEVIINDEVVERIDFEEQVDLVAISFLTSLAPRAYEIADEFMKRGVKVVLGGIHVSMLPDEAIKHADSIVIGEADELWPGLINDFKQNKLQKIYRMKTPPSLTNSPIPRWDLLKTHEYCYFTVQVGRGCPNSCDFCSVWSFNGHKYRNKSVHTVIEEIRYLRAIDPKKMIFFADDNLLAKPEFAKSLFKNLIPLKINSWWCQAAINRLNDSQLLKLMYESGCRAVFIGFESVKQESIFELNKSKVNKVEQYKEIVNLIHKNGIAVIGSFMLGNDNDDIATIEATSNFIKDTNLAFSMINLITPAPGTLLYERLASQGRITSNLWHEYDGEKVCFQTKQISPTILQSERNRLLKHLYKYNSMHSRFTNLWRNKVFVRGRNEKQTVFSKGRFIFTIKTLGFNVAKNIFIIKCLWNKNVTSTSAINLALNFNEYARKLK
ncbi:MAG: radical SAM protein [Actinobacteria bacterium]|nr:MAG: radical SAM protein [Actinomycetota bacterium]